MSPHKPTDLDHHRRRRRRRARDKRMLNNLPMAHRLACRHAHDARDRERLLGQAMIGLVEAADAFEQTQADVRFGAYAEPHITSALERTPEQGEVEVAQAQIAEAISSQERVQQLASFLDVPINALVGGLMDATARDRVLGRYRTADGAA